MSSHPITKKTDTLSHSRTICPRYARIAIIETSIDKYRIGGMRNEINSCELSFSLNGIVYVIYFRFLLLLRFFGLKIQTMFTPLLFFLEGGGAFFGGQKCVLPPPPAPPPLPAPMMISKGNERPEYPHIVYQGNDRIYVHCTCTFGGEVPAYF